MKTFEDVIVEWHEHVVYCGDEVCVNGTVRSRLSMVRQVASRVAAANGGAMRAVMLSTDTTIKTTKTC